jgi:hypothetical protein
MQALNNVVNDCKGRAWPAGELLGVAEPLEVDSIQASESFDGLAPEAKKDLPSIAHSLSEPNSGIRSGEKELPRRTFEILEGGGKPSISAKEEKSLTFRIVRIGEIPGVPSTMFGNLYQMTSVRAYPSDSPEVAGPLELAKPSELSDLNSIGGKGFLNFLACHPDAFRDLAGEVRHRYPVAGTLLRLVAFTTSTLMKLPGFLTDRRRNV